MVDLTTVWDENDDVDNVSTEYAFDPIPSGEYMLAMVESELRPTKNGTGIILNCRFKVIEGEFEGRVIFNRFNVKHAVASTQQWGIADFKRLCAACNIDFPTASTDTSVLYDIPFIGKVAKVDGTNGYSDSNEIKRFYPADNAPPAPAQAPAPRPAAAAPAARPAPAPTRAVPAFMQRKTA